MISMATNRWMSVWTFGLTVGVAATPVAAQGTKVVVNPDRVIEINGKKVFPIGFCLPPPCDGKTPDGKEAYAELKDAGANFLQTGAMGKTEWTRDYLDLEQRKLDAAAKHGMYCWFGVKDLAGVDRNDDAGRFLLRGVVNRFKGHPGLGAWLSMDEPEWKKYPADPLVLGYKNIRELDKDHPVAVNHAPRGTLESLRPYNAACDITGADVYPVGYPPGTHSDKPNKELSMVGDYTKFMVEVADRRPVWMYLQIAFSGVVNEGKTLRFPTFPEERFMSYQAIINGARGLFFFGGSLAKALSEEDAKLGWNWRFWTRVLRPVIEEIGEKSPLYPAIVAGESMVPVKVEKGEGVEFCVREVGKDLLILACKREGPAAHVTFSGLPAGAGEGEVLFESPRTVQAKEGKFKDWFGPFEVHVYRFHQ